MSKNIKKYSSLISNYHNLGKKTHISIEKNLDKKLIPLINEICHNLLNQNVNISKKQKNKLRRHKNLLKCSANKKISNAKKIKKIGQQGKGLFLPLLFSIVTPLLTSLLNKKNKK